VSQRGRNKLTTRRVTKFARPNMTGKPRFGGECSQGPNHADDQRDHCNPPSGTTLWDEGSETSAQRRQERSFGSERGTVSSPLPAC